MPRTATPLAAEQAAWFAALAAAPARRAVSVARRLLRDNSEAEEIVWDAMARLWEQRTSLRAPEAAPAWLLRVVVRQCFRHLRRRRVRELVLGQRGREVDTSPGGDPSHAVAAQQDLQRLLDSIRDLPMQQRAALLLRYGEGLPVDEVAAALAVSVATAKTHLVRGLSRLRAAMEASP